MNTAQETTERNGKTVASMAPVAQPAPMPEFLSRFLPPHDR